MLLLYLYGQGLDDYSEVRPRALNTRLRVIGDEFKREAKSNILEAKNGDDE